MEKIKIYETAAPKEVPVETPSFGTVFSDHMFVMDYCEDRGWYNPRIEPYQTFSMQPSACSLHYGQGIFEGLKAYKNKNNQIQVFRAQDNFKRLNRSASRLCMPEIDVEFNMLALEELLKLEKKWIPSEPGTSLYVRPFTVATEPFLGVRPAAKYKYFIILAPVGAYYPEGLKPVSIMVEKNYVRAVSGGLGEAKTMANYAASLLAQVEAKRKGFTQVLWLDGVEKKYIEEVGTMNIFFKIGGEIITPPLTGSILPGITRDSVLKVLKHWGLPVKEYRLSIDEVKKAYEDGQLEEVFGTGTAAVISPVGKLVYDDYEINLNSYGEDSISMKLYDYITKIQYGLIPDEFNWTKVID